MQAAHCSCSSASWQCSPSGTGRSARYPSAPSTRRRWKPSIGQRLHFPRPWGRFSGIGWPIQGSATRGGALVFGIGLALIAAAYFWTNVSRVSLFWAAFILTRPLGATVGDFLDKPLDHGGLALSRPIATAVLGALIIGCVLLIPQKAGSHPSAAR